MPNTTTTTTPPECFTCGHPKQHIGLGKGYWRCFRCQPGGKTGRPRKNRIAEHLNGHADPEASMPATVLAGDTEVLDELRTLNSIANALLELSPEARARVWAWLASRFATP